MGRETGTAAAAPMRLNQSTYKSVWEWIRRDADSTSWGWPRKCRLSKGGCKVHDALRAWCSFSALAILGFRYCTLSAQSMWKRVSKRIGQLGLRPLPSSIEIVDSFTQLPSRDVSSLGRHADRTRSSVFAHHRAISPHFSSYCCCCCQHPHLPHLHLYRGCLGASPTRLHFLLLILFRQKRKNSREPPCALGLCSAEQGAFAGMTGQDGKERAFRGSDWVEGGEGGRDPKRSQLADAHDDLIMQLFSA
jgi:hypothetical protein